MPKLTQAAPEYCIHKRSGQAAVTLAGRDHYLGPYGGEESRKKYDRLVGEYLAARRVATLQEPTHPPCWKVVYLRRAGGATSVSRTLQAIRLCLEPSYVFTFMDHG